MARAGRVTIDLTAGTAQFVSEMERASASATKLGNSINEAGVHGVTGMQAASATIRTLEGRLDNNIRAAERFIASFSGVSRVLQSIFPVIGATALAGAFFDLGERAMKIKEAFDRVAEAPGKITAAFAGLNQETARTNDGLRVQNDQLEIEIAKLQKHPTNGLQLALDEARQSAGSLAIDLHKALEESLKLLSQKELQRGIIGTLKGEAGTDDIKKVAQGFQHNIDLITAAGTKQLLGISKDDVEGRKAAVMEERIALEKAYAGAIRFTTAELDKRRLIQDQIDGKRPAPNLNSGQLGFFSGSTTAGLSAQHFTIPSLEGLLGQYLSGAEGIGLRFDNGELKGQKGGLEATKTAKTTDYLAEMMQRLRDEMAAAADKTKYAGDIMKEAFAAGADNAIKDFHELERQGVAATNSQKAQILILNDSIQLSKAQALVTKRADEATAKFNRTMGEAGDVATKVADSPVSKELADSWTEIFLRAAQKAKQAVQLSIDQAKTQGAVGEFGATFGTYDEQVAAARRSKLLTLQAQGASLNGPTHDEINAEMSTFDVDALMRRKQSGYGMSPKEGYKAFTSDLVNNFKSAGYQIQQLMGGVFSTLSDQFTSFLSGAKISWSSFFQSLASSFAKFGLNTLFGMLGSWLGKGGLGSAGGFFSGLFKADGGSVMGGSPYVVGERGPELFVPGSGGSIMPNGMAMGGGGVYYNIDARGTDPQTTERNVRRALQLTHTSAVQNGVMATQEMTRRRPR